MPRRRKSASELTRWFEALARPAYAIDAAGRIAHVNPACAAWLQVDAASLVGAPCRYGAADGADATAKLAAGLCPPPEVFQGTRAFATVSAPGEGETAKTRRAEFIPLPMADGSQEEQAVLALLDSDEAPLEETPPGDDSRALHTALAKARNELRGRYRPESLLGRSAAMRRLRRQVKLAAMDASAVSIYGPARSGRQHVARAIHYAQAEPTGPFVPLDCAALSVEMFVSQLAGLANATERAGGAATVYLRGVEALPAEAQEKLFARVQQVRTPLRWMASSETPLEELALAEKFHRELASLLSTIVIRVPSFTERLEDLPLVAQAFLEEQNGSGGRQLSGFTPEALDTLAAHPPAGGWDELAAWVRESHARAAGLFIDRAALPERVRQIADAGAYRRPPEETIDLERFLGEIELELIQRALAKAKGNKTKAAELLGMNRPRFYRRLEQLGLGEGAGDE